MMGIGFPELMVILVIIMIIFGAGKLPQIGSAFGQSIRNFKTSMKEAEAEGAEAESKDDSQVVDASTASEQSAGELPAAAVHPSAGVPQAPSPSAAPKPATTPSPAPAQAAKAPTATAQKGAPAPKGKKKAAPGEKSFEEELIDQAIKEIKDKRVGTIRTPHDGLVQQGDVFTKSVDKTPWHMRGRDRGVNRDVM